MARSAYKKRTHLSTPLAITGGVHMYIDVQVYCCEEHMIQQRCVAVPSCGPYRPVTTQCAAPPIAFSPLGFPFSETSSGKGKGTTADCFLRRVPLAVREERRERGHLPLLSVVHEELPSQPRAVYAKEH